MKKKICIECGKEDFIFSKKRCKFCASKEYNRTTIRNQLNKLKNGVSKSKQERNKERECLKDFFINHINLLRKRKYSDEGGISIPVPSHFHVCHIFPKSRYKSVMCHEENVIYLTIDQHSRFDRLLGELNFDKLEKEFPNSWGKVCKKAEILLPLLEEQGKLRTKFEKYLCI